MKPQNWLFYIEPQHSFCSINFDAAKVFNSQKEVDPHCHKQFRRLCVKSKKKTLV